MQPCKCELAIAALVRAADKRWMSVMIMNSCVTPVSFLIFSFQRNCRYDGQIAVFGSKLQELLGKQRYFLVSGLVHASVSMFRTCVAVTVLPGVFFS